MLIQLKLKNVALIEIIEINFEKGLNIITGDSGSGKSLILDSINALFGGTNIPLNHLIRPGKKDCLIEAKFSCSSQVDNFLRINSFQNNFSELIIKRKSFKKNKKILTKYYVNDLPINKKLLEKLGILLIDFAGQSDSFLFNSQEYRRSIIDDLGSKELKKLNLLIKNTWKNFENLKELMKKKKESSIIQKENKDAIKEMFNILNHAELKSSNEILELQSLENRLANNLQINNSIQEVLNNLKNFSQEHASVDLLISKSIKEIKKISAFDKKIDEFNEKLISVQIDIENLIFELKTYLQDAESSDTSLEATQKRLFFLKNLERTFSLELPQLIEKREELNKTLLNEHSDNDIEVLKAQINESQKRLNSLFIAQSAQRKQIANNLQSSVMSLLNKLGLENAKFIVRFEESIPSRDGTESINFLFSANPDQKLAPLSKIISGGEMSRFLLAIKSSIFNQPNTFFLDEIDNGLSGKSLYSLVTLIKNISEKKQVLCITHQPFLAASGKTHFKVKKNVVNGLTFTSISKLLTKNERQSELIELIGGGFDEADNYASILLERAAA